jgi:hypothetical protein
MGSGRDGASRRHGEVKREKAVVEGRQWGAIHFCRRWLHLFLSSIRIFLEAGNCQIRTSV